MEDRPTVIVLAGPNGAGKSTAATWLVPREMTFVNADEVAKTLPGYPSHSVDLEAGSLVLEQLNELEAHQESFAVEMTLASRSFAPRLARLRSSGYRFRLIFAYLPDVDQAVERVAGRVRMGGHAIPERTIRRRHAAGIRNFFSLYQPLADQWFVYDTTRGEEPRLIAAGRLLTVDQIQDSSLWQSMTERAHDE